jgi:NTE family protein
MRVTVDTIHRRTHSQHFDLLHRLAANGEIEGFLLPYLGQADDRLPYRPPDLVGRSAVVDYPTDFSPMSEDNLRALSTRGEQLTRVVLEAYAPGL